MVFRMACYTRAAINVFSSSRNVLNAAGKTTDPITMHIPGWKVFYSKPARVIKPVNKKWIHPFDTLPWNRTRDRPPRFRRRPPMNIDTPFYQKLFRLLRNGSRPSSPPLPFRPDGFVRVEQLLGHIQDKYITIEDIIYAVKNCVPRQLQLVIEPEILDNQKVNTLWIRVMDGHRIPGINASTRRIEPSEGITTAYYKSTLKQWGVIQKSGIVQSANLRYIGLMQEPQIFGKQLSGLTETPRTTIMIEVDVQQAMAEGIVFYVTEEGQVVTKGDKERCIPAHHIKSVTAYDLSKNFAH